MAEPAPTGGLTGGLLKGLSPKQRRYATAVGVAMILALIVILGRRNKDAPPPADTVPADAAGDLGEPIPLGDPPFQPQSTFADNGEAAGLLSSAITEGLSEVGSSLTDEADAFNQLRDQLGTPATAPGPLGKTGGGKNKGQAAALQKQKQKIAAQKKRIGQLKKQGKKPAPKKPGGPAPKKPPPPKKKKKK